MMKRFIIAALLFTFLISCNNPNIPIATIPAEEFSGETPRPITRDNATILLTSGNYDERLITISMLPDLAIDDQEIIPYLIDNLYYENGYRVRKASATTLGNLGVDAKIAVSDLINALNDESTHVRREAATALGKIGHHSAIPFLADALYYEKESNFNDKITRLH